MRHQDGSFETAVKQQLLDHGWQNEDILEYPNIIMDQMRLVADAILLYNLCPLAGLEIKSKATRVDSATQQITNFVEAVSLPFAFVTNGNTIIEIDITSGNSRYLEQFPSPRDLWSSLGRFWDRNDPRLYPPSHYKQYSVKLHQVLAISRSVENVVNGNKHLLLSMATGSGISYVVLQIAWKLIKSGFCHRILYLSDRQSLLMQTKETLEPLSQELLLLNKQQLMDTNHSVQLSSISNFIGPDITPAYKALPSDFYDLIFMDNVRNESQWLSVLTHFSNATHIFITNLEPTPEIIRYFNQPIFKYSLQEVLQMEELLPPEGYKAIRLGEIADICRGFTPGVARAIEIHETNSTESKSSSAVYLAKPGNIRNDGSFDLTLLEKVDIPATFEAPQSPTLDERYLLQPSDILIVSRGNPTRFRVAFIPRNLPGPTIFNQMLIRVRVNPDLANPNDIYTFLQSDTGQLAMQRFASTSGNTHNLSFSSLAQIKVFLPPLGSTQATVHDLSIVSQAIRQLRDEILPELEGMEQENDQAQSEVQSFDLVAEKLRFIASILSPPSLAERAMQRYPTPIALAYRRFVEARFNIYEQVLRLKDLFEAASFFVYNVVLSDAFRRLDPKQYYVKNKGVRRAYNGYSMSSRMDFVATILLRAEASKGRDLFMPELFGSPVVEIAKKTAREPAESDLSYSYRF